MCDSNNNIENLHVIQGGEHPFDTSYWWWQWGTCFYNNAHGKYQELIRQVLGVLKLKVVHMQTFYKVSSITHVYVLIMTISWKA